MIAALTLAVALAASDVQVIEAEGDAPLSLGFTQAVQRAKDAALRQVILKACKQLSSADPSIAQCAIADDRLFAGFGGVVSRLDVLSQEQRNDAVHVKVRAEISLQAVSSEEVEAKRLFQRLGGLKLSIAINEVIDKGNGKLEPTVQVLGSKLSDQFRSEGWKLFPYVPESPQSDFALVGTIATEYKPPDRMRVSGEVQVLDLGAKKTVGSVPMDVTAKKSAADLIAAEAPALAVKLRAAIVKSLRDAESRGAEVTLSVSGFKNDAQIDALIAHLQRVTGVMSVETKARDAESVQLTVKSTAPAKELARTLAKAMSDELSVTGVRASAIDGTAK